MISSWVWSDGLAAKSTGYSCRGPGFSSQHPEQLAIFYQRIQCPLLASSSTACTWYPDTFRQTYIYYESKYDFKKVLT